MKTNRFYYGLPIVAALAAALYGTGGGMREPPARSLAEPPVAEPLSRSTAAGWRAVALQEAQTVVRAGWRDRIQLPGTTDLLDNFRVVPGSSGVIPDYTGGLPESMLLQNRQREARRGIFDALDSAPAERSSWGWLADDVNAASLPGDQTVEPGGRSRSPAESRRQMQGYDRAGSGSGSGDDTFRFPSFQDNRF